MECIHSECASTNEGETEPPLMAEFPMAYVYAALAVIVIVVIVFVAYFLLKRK
jgi:hypothetical protein